MLYCFALEPEAPKHVGVFRGQSEDSDLDESNCDCEGETAQQTHSHRSYTHIFSEDLRLNTVAYIM